MFNSLFVLKVLIGLVIVLSIIKSITLYYFKDEFKLNSKRELSEEEIKNVFVHSLNSFDLTEKTFTVFSADDIEKYKVNVFSDIPIEIILLELERNYFNSNVNIVAKDSIHNKSTVCKIISKGKIIIQADFSINEKIKRNKGIISVVIKANSSDDILKEIFESPEPISFILVPSKSFHKSFRLLDDHNKKYLIYINDEIKDLIYKFGKNYSRIQIKNTLYNILRDFEHSNKVIVELQNEWIDSTTKELITLELRRNKINVYDSNIFIDLSEEDDYVSDKLISIVNEMSSEEKRIFKIAPEQFSEIVKIFPALRKSGYKIVSLNQTL
jgi:hypothetical protein